MLRSLVLWCGSTSIAWGFCGTYVGGAGSSLYNGASQIAVVRQGTQTTLTMANDVFGSGDLGEFALVVPVPEVLGPDDVSTVDAGVFDVLDGYSAPRLVSYTCDDFYWGDEGLNSAEDGGPPSTEPGADGVTVESAFVVGSYEIVVLSAEESSGLLTWLEANGYNGLDDSAEALLDEYISGGQYFFAAKVFLDAVPEDAAYLEPLQVSYSAEAFSLPIRLGTLNAPPEAAQDLYIYALTDSADGSVGISNYPKATIEDECMWREGDWPSFGSFWTTQVNNAREEAGGAVWIQEYTWNTGLCDPCSGDPPNSEQVQLLGFEGESWDTHFTRLHVQYTPAAADQEIMLYTSNMSESEQIRYIIYEEEFEDRFPICGEETPAEPGSCDDEPDEAGEPDDGEDADADSDADADADADADTDSDLDAEEVGGEEAGASGDDGKGGGCASVGSGAGVGLAWLALALVGVRRRR